MVNYLDDLTTLLRPAGGGIYVVSTGLSEQRELQRALYGAVDDAGIDLAWRAALERLPTARAVILGVPSDVGAGYLRGANQGPAALRRTLLSRGPRSPDTPHTIDVGDVRVVPQLLSDDMLSQAQLGDCREALYGSRETSLPASPLDITRRVLDLLADYAPQAVPLVLGGDHSVGWPAFASAQARGQRLGLLHFDAHTDLLETRLGIRYCFATWAYHANELLLRDGRLVQVGIRASGRDRAHWESTLGVRQYWATECEGRSVVEIGDEIIERFHARGVEAVYVSNDIDGTSSEFAAATGTPEPLGLRPDFVMALTEHVLGAFPLAGADLVEVAPSLGHALNGEPERTLGVAVDYLVQLERLASR